MTNPALATAMVMFRGRLLNPTAKAYSDSLTLDAEKLSATQLTASYARAKTLLDTARKLAGATV